jgi:hypothetical protein
MTRMRRNLKIICYPLEKIKKLEGEKTIEKFHASTLQEIAV